ncbi:polysaccharide ABC transporter ATP-binding protein [Terrimonas sp. NA20]|uniref:Polysaccharide ABC transporter ATP-binding protein n=1 Tax=Terrimonas ginsenosidimutans TaxID=2908004 RepID=A0ABS9KNR3_9BACT|nr:polysaccharide ABC transporter ATP-binding protein [Terrimonas ginsenosidimutans]MCG2613971.1 polysaccharide ABC transporter ATP-binding protein [Terrimonas ginsenosidimutans]
MSESIIKVSGLGKKYIISHEASGKYTTLRDAIGRNIKSWIGSSQRNVSREEFWALRDIYFSINRGDAVGIVGRNGAGKSTLLKVLSRITEPSHGKVEINGRIASLLEVGTGFHQELTGRENIFLNGAILGMSRAEVRAKFDEIVDFSGVETFLDTPVKRYSSGMYVRLAFAVAAHLEPEILVVDEVLAVGDAEFQKKCLGKMDDVSRNQGRTVLFVSHNISAIQQLCNKGIYLERGKLVMQGGIDEVVDRYVSEGTNNTFTKEPKGDISVTHAEIDKRVNGDLMTVTLYIRSNIQSSMPVSIDFRFYTLTQVPVGFASIGTFDYEKQVNLVHGDNKIIATVDVNTFAIGNYLLNIDVTRPNVEYYDRIEDHLSFEIVKETEENRSLQQSWNYGSVQLNATIKQVN